MVGIDEFNPSEDDVDQLQQKALNKVQTLNIGI